MVAGKADEVLHEGISGLLESMKETVENARQEMVRKIEDALGVRLPERE